MSQNKFGRRRMLKLGLIGSTVVPLVNLAPGAWAGGEAEYPKLEDNDPSALQLGYVQDATRVDVDKFPKRAGPDGAEQFCRRCQFFQGESGAPWGPCTIFPEKLVSANGWCNSWFKKVG